MSHDELRDSLWDLFDDALPSDRRKELSDHLEACAECRDSLSRVSRARALFFRAPPAVTRAESERFVLKLALRLPEPAGALWWRWLNAPWMVPTLGLGLAAACLSVLLSSPDSAPADTLMLLGSQDRTLAQIVLPQDRSGGDSLLMSQLETE